MYKKETIQQKIRINYYILIPHYVSQSPQSGEAVPLFTSTYCQRQEYMELYLHPFLSFHGVFIITHTHIFNFPPIPEKGVLK
jgi:hypothetical protein